MNYTIQNPEMFEHMKKYTAQLNTDLFYVHSDILKSFQIKPSPFNPNNLLHTHMTVLHDLTFNKDLWFPIFNLDFPKTKVHDCINTPSQMGHLTEYFRQHEATWNNQIPMHGTCGTGLEPLMAQTDIIDPWGADSVFAELVLRNGQILFYGAGLDAISFIHFMEKVSAVPYRYEKIFRGEKILEDGTKQPVAVAHIVRPPKIDLNYDWNKIEIDLINAGIWMEFYNKRSKLILLNSREVYELWNKSLKEDPFYLLDENSKKAVIPMIDQLQRPFKITDFE